MLKIENASTHQRFIAIFQSDGEKEAAKKINMPTALLNKRNIKYFKTSTKVRLRFIESICYGRFQAIKVICNGKNGPQRGKKWVTTVSPLIKLIEITFNIYKLLRSKNDPNCLPFFYRSFQFVVFRTEHRERTGHHTTLCAMINTLNLAFIFCFILIDQ